VTVRKPLVLIAGAVAELPVGDTTAGAFAFGGEIDCSTNPNYPVASAGTIYRVSQPGKIGGAQGVVVATGDSAFCVSSTGAGTQASVGGNWLIFAGKVPVLGFARWRVSIAANDGDASYTSLDRVQLFVGTTNMVPTAVSFAASSSNGGDGPANVVNTDSDAWITSSGQALPSNITVVLPAPVQLTSYTLTSQHVVTGRAPTAWALQGSNDGEAWTTVDTRTGITGWGIQETRTFQIS
jgi:hypothetical protein